MREQESHSILDRLLVFAESAISTMVLRAAREMWSMRSRLRQASQRPSILWLADAADALEDAPRW